MGDDIFEDARSRISAGLIHAMFQSAGSFSRNGEYYILSPLRSDKHVGSFSINETSGLWRDKATDESGDFIDLVARANGVAPIEAAKLIVGNWSPTYIKSSDHDKKKNEKPLPEPVIPIPEEAIEKLKESLAWFSNESNFDNRAAWFGKATTVHRYFDYEGNFTFVVVRFEKEAIEEGKKREKNDILFYYGDNGKWKAKRHPSLLPFAPYGSEKVIDSVLPILIVEGEKCKSAAEAALEGKYIVLSWVGGTANVHKTDWGKLKKLTRGRKVYLWADADSQRDKTGKLLSRETQPGMAAMLYIKSIIPEAQILEVYRHKPTEDEPDGWDVADHIAEGGDPAQFIEDYTPYNGIDVAVDPFEVYRAFVDNYYDHDNLDQFNGWYWSFDREALYWRHVGMKDVECNLQRWIEETGLQWIISKKCEATEFINKVRQYLGRHSLAFSRESPLREAPVSPFIHFKNGAVNITEDGSEWYGRDKYSDDFFRQLYPISCLNISVDYANYKNAVPERDFPAFYYFVKDMIPRDYMGELGENVEGAIHETLMFFAQVLAYTISSVKQNEYFFGIQGNQRTGKSFFVKIIKKLVGDEFCSERRADDLTNRFAISGLWEKKVYIEPDLDTRQPLPESFIKAYVGEQITTIEEKMQKPMDGVKMSLAMFFVSNYQFHVKGIDGIERRLVLIPFENEIKNHDTRLLKKIIGECPHDKESPGHEGETFDERPGLIALALQGWDAYRDNDFIIKMPEWIIRRKEAWVKEANSVARFIQETIIDPNNTNPIPRDDMYSSYSGWCHGEGMKELGKKNFAEEVRKDGRIREFKQGKTYFQFMGNDKEDVPF